MITSGAFVSLVKTNDEVIIALLIDEMVPPLIARTKVGILENGTFPVGTVILFPSMS